MKFGAKLPLVKEKPAKLGSSLNQTGSSRSFSFSFTAVSVTVPGLVTATEGRRFFVALGMGGHMPGGREGEVHGVMMDVLWGGG